MGLFSRKATASRPAIEYSDSNHNLEASGFWVGWVSYCQPQLEQVATLIGWEPGEQPSPPIVATLTPDRNTPRDPNGLRVDIGGITVGYAPRADHGQRAGQAPVVLVKNGRDILAWVAA